MKNILVEIKVFYEEEETNPVIWKGHLKDTYKFPGLSIVVLNGRDISNVIRTLTGNLGSQQSEGENPLIDEIQIHGSPLPQNDDHFLEDQIRIDQVINEITEVDILDERNTENSPTEQLPVEDTIAGIDETISSRSIKLVVRESALSQAISHARENTRQELGGVLLGRLYPITRNETLVIITGIVRADLAISGNASLNFTEETWASIWRLIDQDPQYKNELLWGIVGWYHTHPSLNVFLSDDDLFIQENFFTAPGNVALVIDPVNGTNGFFGWDSDMTKTEKYSSRQLNILKDEDLLDFLNRNYQIKFSTFPQVEISGEPGPSETSTKSD